MTALPAVSPVRMEEGAPPGAPGCPQASSRSSAGPWSRSVTGVWSDSAAANSANHQGTTGPPKVESALVICPKPLVVKDKWRLGLRRLDEDIAHLDSSTLRHCIDEMQLPKVAGRAGGP